MWPALTENCAGVASVAFGSGVALYTDTVPAVGSSTRTGCSHEGSYCRTRASVSATKPGSHLFVERLESNRPAGRMLQILQTGSDGDDCKSQGRLQTH